MANRQVTNSHKDPEGDIIGLCGPWYPTTTGLSYENRATIVHHIDTGTHVYFVRVPGHGDVAVKAPTRYGRRYLTTHPDGTGRNNLDNLPTCTPA